MNKHYRNALISQVAENNNLTSKEDLAKVETLVDGSDALTGDWESDVEELQEEWEEYQKDQALEEMLDQLRVGFNVTAFGIGFISDEKDLEALKSWIRKMFQK